MQADISAHQLIFNVPDVDPERRQQLVDLLDIDLNWHLHRVSDGQRRRVQICMGLLKPFKVLLLDEVCSFIPLLSVFPLSRCCSFSHAKGVNLLLQLPEKSTETRSVQLLHGPLIMLNGVPRPMSFRVGVFLDVSVFCFE